jgi:hypothetical protein
MPGINRIILGCNTTLAAELRRVLYIGQPVSSVRLMTSRMFKGEKAT